MLIHIVIEILNISLLTSETSKLRALQAQVESVLERGR